MDVSDTGAKKTLTVCASARRPALCARMIQSFVSTASSARLMVYVDNKDLSMADYAQLIGKSQDSKWPVFFHFGPFRYLTEVMNYGAIFAMKNGYDYVSEVNDDHIYRTRGWDTELASEIARHGGGMAYGATQHLPSAVMVDRQSIARLGRWVYPEIKHWYVDNYFKDLWGGVGMLYHIPRVNIEHMHHSFGKGAFDAVYAKSQARDQADYGAYQDWRNREMASDIQKLSAKDRL